MSTTRHTRRKAAQARLALKAGRIAAAALAHKADQRAAVVALNLSHPQSRNRVLAQSVDMATRLRASTHRGFSGQGVASAPKVIVKRRYSVGHVPALDGHAKPQVTREALRHGGQSEALRLLSLAMGTPALTRSQ